MAGTKAPSTALVGLASVGAGLLIFAPLALMGMALFGVTLVREALGPVIMVLYYTWCCSIPLLLFLVLFVYPLALFSCFGIIARARRQSEEEGDFGHP